MQKNHNSIPVWSNVQEKYSNHIIDITTDRYIPNLKDILLKKVSYSPLDFERRLTTCVRGTPSCGAVLPYRD
jgi:beta-carotene ketolase (CrtO type)